VFFGKDIQGLRFKADAAFRRDMQIVFQDPFRRAQPGMSVGDIVAEGLSVHQPGLSHEEREARVIKALTMSAWIRRRGSVYPQKNDSPPPRGSASASA